MMKHQNITFIGNNTFNVRVAALFTAYRYHSPPAILIQYDGNYQILDYQLYNWVFQNVISNLHEASKHSV